MLNKLNCFKNYFCSALIASIHTVKGRGKNAYLPHGTEAVVRSGVEDLS